MIVYVETEKNHTKYFGLNDNPENSYVEASNPNVTVCENRVFRKYHEMMSRDGWGEGGGERDGGERGQRRKERGERERLFAGFHSVKT